MINPFIEQEFNTWKSKVDSEERLKPQTLKRNTRKSSGGYRINRMDPRYIPRNSYYTGYSEGDYPESGYSYRYVPGYSYYTGYSDGGYGDSGYGYRFVSGSSYYTGYSTGGTGSSTYKPRYQSGSSYYTGYSTGGTGSSTTKSRRAGTSHTDKWVEKNLGRYHEDFGSNVIGDPYHFDRFLIRYGYTHSDYGGYYTVYYHSDTYVPHSDYLKHQDTPGRTVYYHSDTYVPHSDYLKHQDEPGYYVRYHYDYYVSHSDYLRHQDVPGQYVRYHYDYYVPHSDYLKHSDTPAYTEYYHTDYYVPHSDVGFDHDDYVPSTPRLFDEQEEIPLLRGETTLAFYSYDKNKDGEGSQTERSKTVYYDVRIRQVKDINGNPKTSSWKVLQNNSTNETYLLNTIDPLGVGNTNKDLTEGYYEIEVTARNATKTLRGVTQTFESQKLVKEVKIQQNLDPDITVTNYTSFVEFVFGRDNVLSKNNELLSYTEYAKKYNLDKYNGILVNMIVVEQDKDQYLKGTGWLEDSNGNKIPGTEQDIVWENGLKTIKTNGISDYNAQLFISKETFKNLSSGRDYRIVIQVKDFLDESCTKPAGATITQKTVSKTNNTGLFLGIDMTLPTVKFNNPSANWVKEAKVDITITDDYIGVDKWRYRILTDGKETKGWSEYSYTDQGNIILDQLGVNVVEVEALDKVGNIIKVNSGGFKLDNELPKIIIKDDVDDLGKQGEELGKISRDMPKANNKIGIDIIVSDDVSGVEEAYYKITNDSIRPTSGWVRITNNSSTKVNITEILKNHYVHIKVIDKAGNEAYGYKGIYRVNDPVVISNLRIKENDPGLMELTGGNPITVDGVKAYVLKKNNFGNRYEVDITNRDEDPIKVEYVVKKDNKEYSKGSTNYNRGKDRTYEFNVNYFNNKLFDTWDDGVYEVEVTAKDYDGEIKDENFMSESKDSVYVLIKRNAPPKPKIIYDESKETVTINYPKETGLFSKPDIMKHYKKQYFINDESGLEDWAGEPIKIDKNCTITALYTDIAGNTSKDVLNIVYKPKVGEGSVEGNLDVLVEETRSSKKYFINTRKNDSGKLDETKLDFLQKFKKE